MSLSDTVVIIPVYNNEKTILHVIENVKEYCPDIIVVNDGSVDSTTEIIGKVPEILLVSYPKNKGKGYALKHGLLKAKELNYKNAITIDADGQHYAHDIPLFMAAAEEHPGAILVGARNLSVENMPGKNSFANRFSNFWFRLQTGVNLTDTQSGYRLYPLDKIGRLSGGYTTKYEFELEILVFAAWRGVAIKNIEIDVYYPQAGERVSHFRPLRDFFRISVLNTILTLIALLWYIPLRFFRMMTWRNIKAFFKKEFMDREQPTSRIVFSVMLGIFMGIFPVWGYQMLIGVFLAHLLKLNKSITLVVSNISIPPMIPFILFGSYVTGCIVTNTPITLIISEISVNSVKGVLLQYLLGSVIFAAVCSLVIGALTAVLLMIFRREKSVK